MKYFIIFAKSCTKRHLSKSLKGCIKIRPHLLIYFQSNDKICVCSYITSLELVY